MDQSHSDDELDRLWPHQQTWNPALRGGWIWYCNMKGKRGPVMTWYVCRRSSMMNEHEYVSKATLS